MHDQLAPGTCAVVKDAFPILEHIHGRARFRLVIDGLNEIIGGYSMGMSSAVDKIVSEALGLPAQARAFVAEKLIESLDAEPGEELSPAWREEVSKRCREIEQGLVELRNAEDVFAKAYATIR